LHPTLGSPARSLNEVYERLGSAPFSAELKLDGQRAQIHACKDADSLVSIWIFSRHLEDMTDKVHSVILQTIRSTSGIDLSISSTQT
jgi:DNA ligase-1